MHESWGKQRGWWGVVFIALVLSAAAYYTLEGKVGLDWWVEAGIAVSACVVLYFAMIGFSYRYNIPFPEYWKDESKDEWEARMVVWEAEFKERIDERGLRYEDWLKGKLGVEEEE